MNAKIYVFVIYVEAIIYLLSNNLHDYTFNLKIYQTTKIALLIIFWGLFLGTHSG